MLEQMDLFMASVEEEQHEERKSELTPRQWQVWRLVEHNSLVELRKTTQREIYEKVYGYEWNDDEKCHDHCPAIWKDVAENNLSLEHDKIIISKNFEYWVGNDEETMEYLNDLWEQLEPRLTRYWVYLKKVKRNGQGKLLSNELKPIDDKSKARMFIESFNPNRVS